MHQFPGFFRLSLRRRLFSVPLLFSVSVGGVLLISASPLAQNGMDSAQQTKEIIGYIGDYAMRICPEQSTKSRNDVTEWGVRGEVGLNKLLSKIASVTGEVAYQNRIDEAEGILQKDLPMVLTHAIDCRLEVTNLFVRTLLPINNSPPTISANQSQVPEDAQAYGPRPDAEINSSSIRRPITTYIVAGMSNNPELNASSRLQKKLEDSGYQVLTAQERSSADIVVEISMEKGDEFSCSSENYGQCSLSVDTYYRAYWGKTHKPILDPNKITVSASGTPSKALDKAVDKATSTITMKLKTQLHS